MGIRYSTKTSYEIDSDCNLLYLRAGCIYVAVFLSQSNHANFASLPISLKRWLLSRMHVGSRGPGGLV